MIGSELHATDAVRAPEPERDIKENPQTDYENDTSHSF